MNTSTLQTPPHTTVPSLKANANFRWLMAGGLLSLLGDQFTIIALPWLVLQLSGDPLSLGFAIALLSAPRAICILLGGALVDRYSPKRVMMITKYVSAVLLGALAVLAWSGTVTLPMVYCFALAIGLSQAFAIPSGTSMLPRAIPPVHLQAANGAMMGVRQLTFLAGPLLAALLIALGTDQGLRGLALAFGVDCVTFVLSAWTLAKVRPLPSGASPPPQNVFRSIAEGARMVWRDLPLRTCFLYWGLVAFCIGGTTQVALPILAKDVLGSATAFGVLVGAHGAGALFGMALSVIGGKLRLLTFGTMLLMADALAGVLLLPLGLIDATWQGVMLLLLIGIFTGCMQIAVFTWIQRRVPPQMLGRTMSMFMFIFMGVAPLSAAGTGYLLQVISLSQLFMLAGGALIVFALLAWCFTPMRRIRLSGEPA